MRYSNIGKRPRKRYVSSQFIGDCGIIIPIPRMRRQRKEGHMKKLWCPKCGKRHRFLEIKHNEFYMTLSGELI